MHVAGYQYNRHAGAPLSVDTTPRPATQEEVWRHATEERFEEYQASGGGSLSMIDHYYDKLLHVARPPPRLARRDLPLSPPISPLSPSISPYLAAARLELATH